MPMNFPDLKSLMRAAEMWKFREIDTGKETEEEYREALADFVQSRDSVEAHEIRTKIGWDQWSDKQQKDHLKRMGFVL